MAYTFFAICAYIFMRAFEVIFADQKERRWYRIAIRVVGLAVLYCALASMLVFYFQNIRPLGFDGK